jgi:hypothetical protein
MNQYAGMTEDDDEAPVKVAKASKPTTRKEEARKVMDTYNEARAAMQDAQWKLREAESELLQFAMKNGMEDCLQVRTGRMRKMVEFM